MICFEVVMLKKTSRMTGMLLILLSIFVMGVSAFVYQQATMSVTQTIKEVATITLLDSDLGGGEIVAYDGDIEMTSEWNVGEKKAVILINGKFLLAHRIRANLAGSVIIVAKYGIGVSRTLVAELGNPVNAILITDEKFYSSVDPNAFPEFVTVENDKKLVIDGSVIAWEDVNFSGRDYGDVTNNTKPVEFFRYDPALLLNSNPALWQSTSTWQELAP